MNEPKLNLTGQWSGHFSYPKQYGPTTPFLASIEDREGRLSGTITEPDTLYGGATIMASIAGLRQGTSVDFTKTYFDAPPAYDAPIDYVGRLSNDGNTVTGVWSLLEFDGTFEMHREATGGASTEEEVERALPEPLLLPGP